MDLEQKLELGRQIWDLCKAGYNRIQILEELGISVQQLEDSLSEFECLLAKDAGRAMEHYRNLDNERIEQVIKTLMPIALGDPDHPLETVSDRVPKKRRLGRGVPRCWHGYSSSTRAPRRLWFSRATNERDVYRASSG